MWHASMHSAKEHNAPRWSQHMSATTPCHLAHQKYMFLVCLQCMHAEGHAVPLIGGPAHECYSLFATSHHAGALPCLLYEGLSCLNTVVLAAVSKKFFWIMSSKGTCGGGKPVNQTISTLLIMPPLLVMPSCRSSDHTHFSFREADFGAISCSYSCVMHALLSPAQL